MRIRSRGALLAFAILAIVVFLVPAASIGATGQKSYVVVMKADPAVAYDGGVPGIPATKPGKGKKINPNSAAVKKYDAHLKSQHNQSLQKVGAPTSDKVNDYTIALNGYSAILTDDQAAALSAQKDVAIVQEDELHQPTTDSSPEFLGLTVPGGAYATGIDGRGVIVGVIDTGIWPEHPSFADDGSYPAPSTSRPVPCEFGSSDPDDPPFTCNNKLIGARQELATYRALLPLGNDFDSARDHAGHGTHTSSTAAGDAGVEATTLGIPRGKISGIAPRAQVIMYKGLGEQGGFTSDLVSAINDAVADGVDVINYSIGGGASVTSGDDIAFLFAADAGVFVATSAGNSGPDPGTIGGPASVPWLTSVGASTQRRSFKGTVVLGNGSSYTGVSLTQGIAAQTPLVDAANAGGDLCQLSAPLDPTKVTGKIVLCRRGVNARVEKSEVVKDAGGVGMILYENSDAGDLMSDTHWVPTVHVDNTPGLAIKSYIAANPGTATAALKTGTTTTISYAPSMTQFSSRGPDPVAPDLIKPDVTAPGIQILAGYSPFPDAGPSGELFEAIAGTSMSSPHVAGLFALLKQVHPDWSAAAAKSALMTTASQDVRSNDRTTQATPFEMGAGHVNPGKPKDRGSSFQPGLVYDAGFNQYLGFLCEAGPEVFANPEATCASLANAGIPTKATDLNLPSIGVSQLAGTTTVKRTVTSVVTSDNGNRTYDATSDAPDGYTVSVSPSSVKLKPGQSATFEVTITNVSAPLGEWEFGSLTWKEKTGKYRITSPIAVNASKFSAPVEITGSGVDGSTSFDVQFGYTGAYAAVPHGLTPATETNDTVNQDPDQTFDPGDVATGGANAHTFDLSDVGVFRVAIPPEATGPENDLDVYVYDPDGNPVASSTQAGTDEEVTIQDPMDGTWTVYVHGWQVVDDGSYTLYSWAVTNATGGSLVANGPSSATNGSVGTIDLSWTGATGWNLGAVDHTEGSTVLGRTLVDVDNR